MPAHLATYHGRRAAQAALLQEAAAPMPAHAGPLCGRGTAQAALLQVPPGPLPAYAALLPPFGRGAAQTAPLHGAPALMPANAATLFGSAAALDAGSPPHLPLPAWMTDDPGLHLFHMGLPMFQHQLQAPAGHLPAGLGTLFP